ncbi:MAG: ribonuclease HI family protein [Candidatus Uhrbacteria bacterium]|nr:ribonuclease HI family protein [Candidatus Uhrbacteria bacterium]
MLKHIRMYADGGSRGNPGPAAGGSVLLTINDDGSGGEVVAEVGKYIGTATNNQAEYTGIIIGLEKAHELGYDVVECRLDSELAVRQLNGQYRVKNPELARMFLIIHNLRTHFRQVTFTHVRREYNKLADAMVNRTIDAALGL